MNERIFELAKQAAAVEGWGPEVWQTTFSEKFAELIVRECADYAEYQLQIGGTNADKIKQHFGVK
jgi:hypothetical protein